MANTTKHFCAHSSQHWHIYMHAMPTFLASTDSMHAPVCALQKQKGYFNIRQVTSFAVIYLSQESCGSIRCGE